MSRISLAVAIVYQIICLVIVDVPLVRAAITSSGDASPDPASILPTQTITVGDTSNGEVTVDGGSVLETSSGRLGRSDGVIGTVTVEGTGSEWRNTYGISFGSFLSDGAGHLIINNGGLVDAGSHLTAIYSGSHLISMDGGTLKTKWFNADPAIIQGTGVVESNGWQLDGTHEITSIADLPSSQLLDDQPDKNITVNIDWMGGQTNFGVNNGDVTISNGTQISSSRDGYVARWPGTTGSLTLNGAGTQWEMLDLWVGRTGHGSLTVGNGAVVHSYNTFFGYDLGGSATVNVDGANSKLEVESLAIGDAGDATLNISSGGEVFAKGQAYLGANPIGNGVINISGVGSKLTTDNSLIVGGDGDGELHVSDGGRVTTGIDVSVANSVDRSGTVTVDGMGSHLEIGRAMFLGAGSEASMSITGGGVVTSESSSVGLHGPDKETQVVIEGIGSRWSITGDLEFGERGPAAGTISNGGVLEVAGDLVLNQNNDGTSIHFNNGTINARTVLAKETDLQGVGTINAKGWLLNQNLTVSSPANLPTQFTLDDQPGQNIVVNLDWDGSGAFGSNQGQVTIANGMVMQSSWGYVGYHAGFIGAVSVEGLGTEWNMDGRFNVGDYGQGTLNVTGGASISSLNGNIGVQTGSKGIVNIDGIGSSWEMIHGLELGSWGKCDGELHITGGGSVAASSARIGHRTGSKGIAIVDGPGSSLKLNKYGLTVSWDGLGVLAITNGGLVSNGRGYIADGHNTDGGMVVVDGPGSTWANSDDVRIGMKGLGILHVKNGGLVSVEGSLHVEGGSLINMETGGMLALLGDADDSLADFLNLISGTGEINYWDGSVWADISSAILGTDYTIDYLDTGDLSGYTVLTVGALPLLDGDFDANGVVDGADFLKWQLEDGTPEGLETWQSNYGSRLPSAAIGDFNNDGDVDGADFLRWQRGESPNPLSEFDLLSWQASYGRNPPPASLAAASTTVPEPSSLLLTALAGVLMVSARQWSLN
jgi:T5SS/PEP-CTERM-associated repeat protein